MISLSETYSPNSSVDDYSITNFFISILRSFSQLFFSTKPYIGLIFLSFTSYLSIEATIYALLGSSIAYATSALIYKKDGLSIRHSGGAGYNCCIIGFFLTDFISSNLQFGLATLVWSCILAVILNRYIHTFLYKVGGFPALTLSATIVIILAHTFYLQVFNLNIQSSFSSVYIEDYYLKFYIGYMAIYAISDLKNSIISIVVTIPVLYLSIINELNLSYLIINLAIASFAPIAYFAKNTKIGTRASLISSFFCVPIFIIGDTLQTPFLLLPAIFSIWLALFMSFGRYYHLPITENAKNLAKILSLAKKNKLKVCCLSGAGISTRSGIPDYTSSTWVEKDVPDYYYNFNYFLSSRTARKIYFSSCHKFMNFLKNSKPSSIHYTLMSLQKNGFLDTIITQNVDGLLQEAGCKNVIEIHGKMNSLVCLKCGIKYQWPKEAVWESNDLFCEKCNGFIKPAVKAYGEPLDYQCWENACTAASKSDILLILGTRMFVASAVNILEIARGNGAKIVFVNDSWVAAEYKPEDIIIYANLENILPTISALLEKEGIKMPSEID